MLPRVIILDIYGANRDGKAKQFCRRLLYLFFLKFAMLSEKVDNFFVVKCNALLTLFLVLYNTYFVVFCLYLAIIWLCHKKFILHFGFISTKGRASSKIWRCSAFCLKTVNSSCLLLFNTDSTLHKIDNDNDNIDITVE